MAISITDDDLAFLARRFSEALHARAPEWTRDNAHDPGVTLLEAFAFLAEAPGVYHAARSGAGAAAVARLSSRLTRARVSFEGMGVATRVDYFDGQLLTADDFRAEQDYVRHRLRRLALAAVGPGVVSGLEVSAGDTGDGSPVVTVTPGVAITPHGNDLVVATPRCVPIACIGATAFVVISLEERAADEKPSRIVESASITIEAAPTGDHVVLARIERHGDGWRVIG